MGLDGYTWVPICQEHKIPSRQNLSSTRGSLSESMYDPTMRVLTVLEMLQARRGVTGAELAARLEVHPRTVQRYIARLQDLGVPVESKRGTGGAYTLKPGFRLPPLMFTDDEALSVMLGLQTLRHLGLIAFAPATEGAAAKVRRALPHAVAERVKSLEDAIEVDVPPWKATADASRVIEVAAAVQGKHPLRIRYASGGETQSAREVEPYGVVHHEGRWYLVGHCRLRKAVRSFRVDRILELYVLEGTFEMPSDFSAKDHLHQSIPFAPSPWAIELWIGLPLEDAQRVVPYARAVLEASREGTRVRCGVEDLDWFAVTVLSLNCTVEVVRPPELVEAFARVALRAQSVKLISEIG